MSQRSASRARLRSPKTGGWSTPLPKPITLKDGTTLATLEDAGMFIADYPAPRMGWNAAGAALINAAEKTTSENIEEAVEQTKSVLYFAKLLPDNDPPPKPRSGRSTSRPRR